MQGNKKPSKCCKPDCFHCPYPDCIYDGMEIEDYVDSIDEFATPLTELEGRKRAYQKRYRETFG